MDTTTSHATPSLATSFRLTFPSETKNPYPKTRIASICQNRAALHTTLFIDHLLLHVAHLPPPSPYPPRSAAALHRLHSSILTAPSLDTLKKHCFIYYLLLDWEHCFPTPHGEVKLTDAHRARTLLPDNFVELMTGLWELDNLEIESAVRRLGHPGVTAPLPGKVLGVLAEYGTATQVVGFVRGTGMELGGVEDVERYFYAMVELDVGAALGYLRDAPGDLKEGLFRGMVERCVEVGGTAVVELVGLPLGREEMAWLVEGLRESEEGRDALVVWWTHMGRFEEALEVMGSAEARKTAEKGGQLDWGVLGETLRKGLGPRVKV